jgi:hypothetical protein
MTPAGFILTGQRRFTERARDALATVLGISTFHWNGDDSRLVALNPYYGLIFGNA